MVENHGEAQPHFGLTSEKHATIVAGINVASRKIDNLLLERYVYSAEPRYQHCTSFEPL